MLPSPRSPQAVLTALVSLLALLAATLTAVVLTTASPGRAAGFGDGDLAWSPSHQVLPSGLQADGARVEPLPGGGAIAVLLADGDDHGFVGQTVLVSRTRAADGTWAAPQTVPLGTGDVWGRTFDTASDSAGRVLAVWAEKSVTSGHWPVRSLSRDVDGTWGSVEEVYTARTDGALGDLNEVPHIRPRLVRVGDTVTVAWGWVEGMPSARVPVDDDPFRARRWTAGTWGPELRSDGYGAEGPGIAPMTGATSIGVQADPKQAVRASDGRISYVFTLRKHRPVHTMTHELSDGFAGQPNVADVWDGVPEAPWQHSSTTAWVVHLDPAGGWSDPALLVTSAGTPVICGSPALPANPPLVEFFDEWKAFSQDPGINMNCPDTYARATSASYAADGELRIGLDHKSDPSTQVVLNQFLSDACDDPGATDSYRFCFDQWGGVDWGTDWPSARISVAPGASRPAPDAVQEGAPQFSPATYVLATGGDTVTVAGSGGADGKAISFDRATGTDVTWTPDATASGPVRVSHAFAHGGDVAAFFRYGSETSLPRCGLVVLRAGAAAVEAPLSGCVSDTSYTDDVVQLADGALAWINGNASGVPVRTLGVGSGGTTTPPAPNPLPPAPSTFGNTAPAKVKGTARVGRTLKARPGSWSPSPTSISYRWLKGRKPIPGATKRKLKVSKKYVGKRLAVRITLSRTGVTTKTVTVKVKGKVRR